MSTPTRGAVRLAATTMGFATVSEAGFDAWLARERAEALREAAAQFPTPTANLLNEIADEIASKD